MVAMSSETLSRSLDPPVYPKLQVEQPPDPKIHVKLQLAQNLSEISHEFHRHLPFIYVFCRVRGVNPTGPRTTTVRKQEQFFYKYRTRSSSLLARLLIFVSWVGALQREREREGGRERKVERASLVLLVFLVFVFSSGFCRRRGRRRRPCCLILLKSV